MTKFQQAPLCVSFFFCPWLTKKKEEEKEGDAEESWFSQAQLIWKLISKEQAEISLWAEEV